MHPLESDYTKTLTELQRLSDERDKLGLRIGELQQRLVSLSILIAQDDPEAGKRISGLYVAGVLDQPMIPRLTGQVARVLMEAKEPLTTAMIRARLKALGWSFGAPGSENATINSIANRLEKRDLVVSVKSADGRKAWERNPEHDIEDATTFIRRRGL